MARIGTVEIPKKKRIVIALTYIHGIGLSSSKSILKKTQINPDLHTNKLTDEQVVALQNEVNQYRIEGDVRRVVAYNIKRLKEITSYRGVRHRKGLPVRGQITQKNARTCKGPRKTVANKKKPEK
ncbi:MAG: 30S ribosomal protein S13 [Mollicutes bacterium]|nr:MAG: 30S ribosomal protein S13 [Mollicutes bacterium]